MRSAAAKLAVAPDPTVYPIEDDMGEGSLQRLLSELLRVLIERYLVARGKPTFVGADQFFYWKQFDSSEGIAPDVYVLPGAPLSPRIGAWKVWETGFVPSFAFEVVSTDVDKDYLRSPAKYARLGVEELIVFDPDHAGDARRARFQVFRKSKRGLLCVEQTNADRVRSKVLGCHLRAVGDGGDLRVRLATGFNGETLFPTDVEARARSEEGERAAHARAEAEQARAETEQARAEAEQARAETEQARAETEQARAEASEAALATVRAEADVAVAALSAERALRAQLERELARLRAGQKKARSGKQ
ncbi:MAG: Uma2 family endonuclease [Minicystis sp.]